MDKPYTVNETKDLLKISRAKLYRIIREGRITPVKLDGRTLFLESEINRFLETLKNAQG